MTTPADLRSIGGWIAAALLAAAVFGSVQSVTPHAIGVDGLFHIKAAAMIGENLPAPWMERFDWLEHTALRQERFADFHWGYHLLLLPFTGMDLEWGAKLAPVVFATASFLALYFVMGRFGVRCRLVWLWLAVVSSPIFLFRLSQNKAPTIVVGLLILVAWAVSERRDRLLAVLCLVTMWVYPVPPLIAGVLGCALAARALCSRPLPVRSALLGLAGMVAGLVLHPDLPRNVQFMIVNLTGSVGIRAGEYRPLGLGTALADLGPLAAIVLAALVALIVRARGTRRERPREATLGMLFCTALTGLVTARYVRGIDYLPPFAVLFASLCLDPYLSTAVNALRARLRPVSVAALTVAVALLLVAPTVAQVRRGREIADRNSADVAHRLRDAALWLADNSEPGELVVNLSSGDFEELWIHNTHNRYFLGLNVNFLMMESPGLFDEFGLVYQRGDMAALHRLVAGRLSAPYVLASDRLPPPILDAIVRSPLFEVVYRDRSCLIARPRG